LLAPPGKHLTRQVKRPTDWQPIVTAIRRDAAHSAHRGIAWLQFAFGPSMQYTLYSCSTHEAIDTVEMHVLAKAYRAAWRSMWASDPAGPHLVNGLDLVIDFGPTRPVGAAPTHHLGAGHANQRAPAGVTYTPAPDSGEFSIGASAAAAAEFARWAHRDQRVENGVTPYFEGHVLAVVDILLEIGASEQVLAAGYLCDVLGQTSVTLDQIEERFGAYVAALVAGTSGAWHHAAHSDHPQRKALELERLALESAEVQTLTLAHDLANLRDPHWLRQALSNGWLAEIAARVNRLMLTDAQLLHRVRAALALWQAIPRALPPRPD